MDSESYITGLFCGVVATAIVAFVLNQVAGARKQMGGADQPLHNFPDGKQGDLTAKGIVKSSRGAAFNYILWMFALLVVLIVSCAGLSFVLRL
jgi:hypothetical protein